jgi:hypothetical protein
MTGHHTSRPGCVISLPKHAVRSVGRFAFRLGDVPRLGPGGGLRGGGRAGVLGVPFWRCHFGSAILTPLSEEVVTVCLRRSLAST